MAQCKCRQPLRLDYEVSQFLIVNWWHCMPIKGKAAKPSTAGWDQAHSRCAVRGGEISTTALAMPMPSSIPSHTGSSSAQASAIPIAASVVYSLHGSKLCGQHSRRRRRKPHHWPHFLIVIVPILNSSCRLVTDAAPGLVSPPFFSPYFMLEGLVVQCQCASLSVRSCRWIASHSASAVST